MVWVIDYFTISIEKDALQFILPGSRINLSFYRYREYLNQEKVQLVTAMLL